jgi:UDP-N-acetylglucosamine 2-epimerase (non-hydrolysing)
MKKIVVVFGTRPEAIKMCPVIDELKSRQAEGIDVKVCVTGQHREMLDQVLGAFGVVPDYDLTIMKDRQTLFDITSGVMDLIRPVFEREKPCAILVHGDTTTTFAAALSAFYLNIPVGHVEAGLRTYNIRSPYPEEFNRQATDAVTSFYFAPTKWAAENLLREGKPQTNIIVTGNTVIDALATTIQKDYSHPILNWAHESRLVLLTAHRRENLGEPMRQMLSAIKDVVVKHPDVKLVYPLHRNPQVREVAEEVFAGYEQIRLIEPLGVLDFHNFMAHSYLILTDSGGIQEEAPSLGKPVLVMRDTTERPEGVDAGTLKLVGTEGASVAAAFTELLDDVTEYKKMSETSNPYGDGKASRRIADFLVRQRLP